MSKIYCRVKDKSGQQELVPFNFGSLQDNLAFIKDQSAAKKDIEQFLSKEVVSAVLAVVR